MGTFNRNLVIRRHLQAGISLIEVMIAIVVLSTGILALTLLQVSVTRAAAEAKLAVLLPAPPSIALPPGSPKALSDEDAALFLKEDKLTDADKAKRDQIRAQVISEIQSTERSYVQALDALQQSFVTPLKLKMADSKHFQGHTRENKGGTCNGMHTHGCMAMDRCADGHDLCAASGCPQTFPLPTSMRCARISRR